MFKTKANSKQPLTRGRLITFENNFNTVLQKLIFKTMLTINEIK